MTGPDHDPADVDTTWVRGQVTRIVTGADSGDYDAVADALAGVAQRYGAHGMWLVCAGLADSIVQIAGYTDPALVGGYYGMEVHVVGRGPVQPEDVDLDKAARRAVVATRFLVAKLNGDMDQMWALFAAADTPEATRDLPLGLVALVVDAYRRRRRDNVRSLN